MQDPKVLHYADADDEKTSWLRVAIRRDMIDDVMYCGLRMDPMDAWMAMLEASFEDVGLCDPFAAVETFCSYEEWEAYENEREHGVSQAVLLRTGIFLARAPKSRVVEHCKIVHLVHLQPEVGEEDKTVSLDPFRGVRLDAYRLSDAEPWPVRQSLVCVARAIMEKDDDRAVKSAVRLHVLGKGHLVWVILACLQDKHPDCYGWTRSCTESYAKAWRLLVTHGPGADRPSVRGMAAIVQGVLLLPFRHNVPHDARNHPWGVRTILTREGFPRQDAIKRSDMPYWLDLAKAVCARMEGRKRRSMPDCALNMFTRRGRLMGRGVKHFLQNAAVITNVPHNPPLDKFKDVAVRGLADTEALAPLRGGLQSLVDVHSQELQQALDVGSPSRTPSPMERSMLPGFRSSSLDEIPSSPESPSKKRRTMCGGGIILPLGLQHRLASENLGYIVKVGRRRLGPSILCNSLRRLLTVKHRPPFCPQVLQIMKNKENTRAAIVGPPWKRKDAFDNLLMLHAKSAPSVPSLGCLAFRFVFEVRGGLSLCDPNAPATSPLYSLGEREVMSGPPSGSFPGAWRDFLSLADGSGVLDASIEAMGLWKIILTTRSEAVVKALPGGMPSFVRVMENVESLLSKDGWFSEAFLCTIQK